MQLYNKRGYFIYSGSPLRISDLIHLQYSPLPKEWEVASS